jgi:[methyl-Co(III) methanol-specific corrinoid protein]:coenzyme M methyltransferase
MTSCNDILALFNKQKPDVPPLFSGLISVTEEGLKAEGLHFHETHRDAAKMARASASSYRVSGFGSAVVPLDMYVEAEALGAVVDFREEIEWAEHPRVTEFLYKSVEEFTAESQRAQSFSNIERRGRIPLVCEAIELLKEDVGEEIAIGAFVPGPWTLLSLLVETMELYTSMRRKADVIHAALEITTGVLAAVGNAYHEAGADFLTIHEMGGSPGVLGPRRFESVILPHLQALISSLPEPVVLSACGQTNGAMKLLAASGADALSVDQTNDLVTSRQELPDVLLFGNLDPVGLISQGKPDEIAEAVASVVRSGADAVWPGCDLYLQTPIENLRALVHSSKSE